MRRFHCGLLLRARFHRTFSNRLSAAASPALCRDLLQQRVDALGARLRALLDAVLHRRVALLGRSLGRPGRPRDRLRKWRQGGRTRSAGSGPAFVFARAWSLRARAWLPVLRERQHRPRSRRLRLPEVRKGAISDEGAAQLLVVRGSGGRPGARAHGCVYRCCSCRLSRSQNRSRGAWSSGGVPVARPGEWRVGRGGVAMHRQTGKRVLRGG
jgi:hypothetical protein